MGNEYETKTDKFSKFIKENLINFILVLICLVYIARSIATIDTKDGASIEEIIADGFLAFIVGISIKTCLRMKGINNGSNSPMFINTCNIYGDKVTEISPNIQYLDKFCEMENYERLKIKQIRFLTKNSISYNDFINNVYITKPIKKDYQNKNSYKLSLERYKICIKARNLHIFNYTSKMLTNAYDSSANEEQLLKASTKKYQTKNTLMNIIMSGSASVLFGYYCLGKGQFEWSNVIWCALQVAIFLLFGCIDYLNANEYVTKTIREKVKRVITIIDKFQNNLHLFKEKEIITPIETKGELEVNERI